MLWHLIGPWMRSHCVTVEPEEPTPLAEQIHHSQSPDTSSSNHSNARHKRQARKKARKKEREQTKKDKRDREK